MPIENLSLALRALADAIDETPGVEWMGAATHLFLEHAERTLVGEGESDKSNTAREAIWNCGPPARSQRAYPLGLMSAGSVEPGGTDTVITRQELGWFLGQRLVLPSELAACFAIDDIRIAGRSQFVADGSVPGRAFAENRIGLRFDPLPERAAFELDITNIGDLAATFRAAVLGFTTTLEEAQRIAHMLTRELESAESLESDAGVYSAQCSRELTAATDVVDAIQAAMQRAPGTD